VGRVLIPFVAIGLALIAQLTIINRLNLRGGAGPDLVLLVVAALALAGGPMRGMLTGFCAGLVLDMAPPASQPIGQYALVFCLVGYACGLAAGDEEHTVAFHVAVTAGGAAVGSVLQAGLGMMLSDPRITWPAIQHVLPVSLLYDLLLCPFVLFALVPVTRWAARADAGREGALSAGTLAASAYAGPRPAPTVHTPRLRLAERRQSDGWIGRGSQAMNAAPGAKDGRRRVAKLRIKTHEGSVRGGQNWAGRNGAGHKWTGGRRAGTGWAAPKQVGHGAAPKFGRRVGGSAFGGSLGGSSHIGQPRRGLLRLGKPRKTAAPKLRMARSSRSTRSTRITRSSRLGRPGRPNRSRWRPWGKRVGSYR
jgi:rod shape-determining protein MreD